MRLLKAESYTKAVVISTGLNILAKGIGLIIAYFFGSNTTTAIYFFYFALLLPIKILDTILTRLFTAFQVYGLSTLQFRFKKMDIKILTKNFFVFLLIMLIVCFSAIKIKEYLFFQSIINIIIIGIYSFSTVFLLSYCLGRCKVYYSAFTGNSQKNNQFHKIILGILCLYKFYGGRIIYYNLIFRPITIIDFKNIE